MVGFCGFFWMSWRLVSYPNGTTFITRYVDSINMAGLQENNGAHARVKSWSKASFCHFRNKMASMRPGDDWVGCSVTLTVRDVPTDERWVELVTKLRYWFRDHKVAAIWLVEWQLRGAPHLHVMLTGSTDIGEKVKKYWLKISRPERTLARAQHVTAIYDREGFDKYLTKHATKGWLSSLQKSSGMPKGWKRSGRMWGITGHWDMVDQSEILDVMIEEEDLTKIQNAVSVAIGKTGVPRYWDNCMAFYGNIGVDLLTLELIALDKDI